MVRISILQNVIAIAHVCFLLHDAGAEILISWFDDDVVSVSEVEDLLVYKAFKGSEAARNVLELISQFGMLRVEVFVK